jgi:hypothetical protein
MDEMTKSLNHVIDEIQKEWGADKVLIWMRSHHRTGCIYAWRVLIKDSPINCFAVMSNGEVHRGRHDNLVGLFSGPGDVAIGAKKKFHNKY